MSIYHKIISAGLCLSLVTACGDDFLTHDMTENSSKDQVAEVMKKDPSAVQGFVTGFYKNLFSPASQQSHDDFGLKALELATDLMGDDMAYPANHFFVYDYQWDNRGATYRRTTQAWQQLYAVINGANQTISSLKEPMESMDEENLPVAQKMIGQAYAMRAYSYYWLVNMYQHPYLLNKEAPGIPLYTESETLLARQPLSVVYAQIVSDLDLAYTNLKGKGITSKSELNEYATAAIYANVLSFMAETSSDWAKVAEWASLAAQGGVLLNSQELLSGFNDVNLSEVLWGADINSETNTFYASFFSHVDPYSPGYGGGLGNFKMIASDLYAKIADTDVRKQWFGVMDLEENSPHYANRQFIQKKFVDVGSLGVGDVFTSDYIYLRVAEMYFVQAEALYRAGKESDAKAVLEEIMLTRDTSYNVAFTGEALLDEIMLQKRIEMWGEGRRFFDMKRRGEALDRTGATNHLSNVIKEAPANDARMIYMIPQSEVNANAELAAGELNP